MIKGIGIDAVELPRIARIIEEKPSFAKRVLTKHEHTYFDSLPKHRKIEFLGGRFACKEAFSKAFGTGIGKVTFQDLEILTTDKGAPVFTRAPWPLEAVHVSITHTDTTAFAQVLLEQNR